MQTGSRTQKQAGAVGVAEEQADSACLQSLQTVSLGKRPLDQLVILIETGKQRQKAGKTQGLVLVWTAPDDRRGSVKKAL